MRPSARAFFCVFFLYVFVGRRRRRCRSTHTHTGLLQRFVVSRSGSTVKCGPGCLSTSVNQFAGAVLGEHTDRPLLSARMYENRTGPHITVDTRSAANHTMYTAYAHRSRNVSRRRRGIIISSHIGWSHENDWYAGDYRRIVAVECERQQQRRCRTDGIAACRTTYVTVDAK